MGNHFSKKSTILSLLGSFFFSFCLLIGTVYAPFGEETGTVGSLGNLSACAVLCCLLTLLFYPLLRRALDHTYHTSAVTSTHPVIARFLRHPFLFSLIVLLLCRLPFLILYYPGNVPVDGYYQLSLWTGHHVLDNRHPIFTTAVLGTLFQLGALISDNVGVFLISLFQTLLDSVILALAVKKLLCMGGSVRMGIGSLLFFALVPIWSCYGTVVMKDSTFFALFLLYFLCYLEAFSTAMGKDAPLSWRQLGLLALICFLICICRHGTSLIVLPSLILLLCIAHGSRRRLLALIAALFLSTSCYNTAIEHTVGPAPSRSTYSLFFQQTARYMQEYPDDVSEEEYEAISAILNPEVIVKRFHPLYSDPVKATFNTEATGADILHYFEAWFSMFLKHPGVYFETAFQYWYGYLDPFHNECVLGTFQTYINQSTYSGTEIWYDLSRAAPESVIASLNQYNNLWETVPILNLLLRPGAYTWAIVYCFLLLWNKGKYREMTVLAIPILQLGICLVSPVNGSVRYALPQMAIMPVLLSWTWLQVAQPAAAVSPTPSKSSEEYSA